jgi:hypothetical protein
MAGLVLIGSVLTLLLVSWLAGWRTLSRGVVAVLAGYASLVVPFVLLINVFSEAVFSPSAGWDIRLVAFLVGIAGVGLLGGFVTASVARQQPLLHSAGLAAFLTAFATISLLSAPEGEPRLTRIITQAVLIPAVLLGGFMRMRLRSNKYIPDRM